MLTFFGTCFMKSLLHWEWGGVGWDANVLWHLLHEVVATLRMGFGGVGWDNNVIALAFSTHTSCFAVVLSH